MQKKIAVIWGTGGTAINFLKVQALHGDYNIIAFVDNDYSKWGKRFWNNILIIEPNALKNIVYDVMIVCSLYFEEISEQLMQLGVSLPQIILYKDIEYEFCQKLVTKYKDVDDEEIKNTLKVLEQGKINVLGAYIPKENYISVYWDDEYPYINFYGKRMYFPKDYPFWKSNGQDFVKNILGEQEDGSPHKYIRDDIEIASNSIIVDAGVCEGNFALKYIDKVKKIYLIEVESRWMEVLRKTFADYEEKVVFCNKFLSRFDNEHEITLDSLIPENETIDFLKMDIEGAEVDALLGAKEVLERSMAECAVCSYHKQYDEKYISFILESYGYNTSHSDGYMCFPYDINMKDTMDLRRGIIYASK